MAQYPFLVSMTVVLTANGRGTGFFSVPTNEEFEFRDLIVVSTGTFNLIAIRSQNSIYHTNSDESNPIKSSQLKTGGVNFNGIIPFLVPINVTGGNKLEIDLKDTSAAGNTVSLLLSAIRSVK